VTSVNRNSAGSNANRAPSNTSRERSMGVNKHASPAKGGEGQDTMSSLLKSPIKTKLQPLPPYSNSADVYKKLNGLQGSAASGKGAVMADHSLSGMVVQPSKFM